MIFYILHLKLKKIQRQLENNTKVTPTTMTVLEKENEEGLKPEKTNNYGAQVVQVNIPENLVILK